MIKAELQEETALIEIQTEGKDETLEQELIAIIVDALDRLTEDELLEDVGTAIQGHKKMTGEAAQRLTKPAN